jgi:DNA-binding NarL/FixJ family response regulator
MGGGLRWVMGERRHVLLVVPDIAFRDSLVLRLSEADCDVSTCLSVPEAASRLDGVDVLVLDLSLPDPDAVDFVRRVRSLMPRLAVLALATRTDDERLVAAVRAGALGCLYADDAAQRLPSAVAEAVAGGRPMSRGMGAIFLECVRRAPSPSGPPGGSVLGLTERERAVLDELARGLLYEDVGRALGISVNTVRSFVRTIYGKLGVNSRTEAVLAGLGLGLIREAAYPRPPPR